MIVFGQEFFNKASVPVSFVCSLCPGLSVCERKQEKVRLGIVKTLGNI